MPVSRRLLTEDEEIVVDLRPHWTYLGRSLPVAVAAVAILVTVSVVWPSAPTAVNDALLVVVGLALLWLGVRTVRWRNTTLVLTTARILQRSGMLARRGLDIRLERVNEISYHQSIPARLLGTGELILGLGREKGSVVFDHVRRPAVVASVLHERIDVMRRQGSPGSTDIGVSAGGNTGSGGTVIGPSPGWPEDTPPTGVWAPGTARHRDRGTELESGSVARQLVELDELRRRGILTEEEFARKKAELLDRM